MWILRAKGLHGDGSKEVGKIRGSEWANQNLGFMKKSYEMTPVLSRVKNSSMEAEGLLIPDPS